jgi:uncharacterized SAM-dependent methyltransferase
MTAAFNKNVPVVLIAGMGAGLDPDAFHYVAL